MRDLTRLLYAPDEDTAVEAILYATHVAQTNDGEAVDCYAVAWLPKQQQWITAPIWYFKPVENKLLKEG